MRMALLRTCAALALLLSLNLLPGASLALAQDQPVDLRLRLAPGQVHQYQITINTSSSGAGIGAMAAEGLSANISVPLEVLTVQANPDRSGTLVITFGDATVTGPGGRPQPLPTLSGTRVEETLDAAGNVVDVRVTPENDNLTGGMSPLSFSNQLLSGVGCRGRCTSARRSTSRAMWDCLNHWAT